MDNVRMHKHNTNNNNNSKIYYGVTLENAAIEWERESERYHPHGIVVSESLNVIRNGNWCYILSREWKKKR